MTIQYNGWSSGIVHDAIGVKKFLDLGDPFSPVPPPEDFEGLYALIIERRHKKDIIVYYDSKKDRDKEYKNICKQMARFNA